MNIQIFGTKKSSDTRKAERFKNPTYLTRIGC